MANFIAAAYNISMNLSILTLITAYSIQYGLDPKVVTALIKTESQFNRTAIGSVGEVGLMQLRPELFVRELKAEKALEQSRLVFKCQILLDCNVRMMLANSVTPFSKRQERVRFNYHSKKVQDVAALLFNPEINLKLGVKYLASLKGRCGKTNDIAFVICFNRGVRGASKVSNWHSDKYVKKIKKNIRIVESEKPLKIAMGE